VGAEEKVICKGNKSLTDKRERGIPKEEIKQKLNNITKEEEYF